MEILYEDSNNSSEYLCVNYTAWEMFVLAPLLTRGEHKLGNPSYKQNYENVALSEKWCI